MNVFAKDSLLSEVASYYASKLAKHGETPQGVDWNGEESQTLRFRQLCKVVDGSKKFTVNDLGCGYGALYDFLIQNYKSFGYLGVDVSEAMISAAKKRYQHNANSRFVMSDTPDQIADYGIASGIFNVRLGRSDAEWQSYLEATLNTLDRTSRMGFSFNCLTTYSDADKMRSYLYYADPSAIFDLCKRRYSSSVALLHDYGVYEFTVLVRKRS